MNYLTLQQMLVAILLTTLVPRATAQKNYVTGNVGYAIPAAGFTYALTRESMTGIVNAKASRNGPNSGFNFGAEIGRKYSSNIVFFLGINYLNGSQKESLRNETTISGSLTRKYTADMEASSFRVLPGIKFIVGNNSAKPYLKFGAGIYCTSKVTVDMSDSYNSGMAYMLVKQTSVYKGRMSYGFVSGIGIDFKLKKGSFFLESSFCYQNINFKTKRITVYTENGVDQLYSLKRSERDVEYSRKYSYYNSGNTNEPAQAPAESLPFSQINFSAGFLFPF